MITLGVPPRTMRPADRSIECRPACDLPRLPGKLRFPCRQWFRLRNHERRSRSRLAQQLRWIVVLWGWR